MTYKQTFLLASFSELSTDLAVALLVCFPEQTGDVVVLVVPPEVRAVGPGVRQVPGGSTQLADHQPQLGADDPALMPETVAPEDCLRLSVLLTEPANPRAASRPPGAGAAAAGAERHLVGVKVPQQRVGRQGRLGLQRRRRNRLELWRNRLEILRSGVMVMRNILEMLRNRLNVLRNLLEILRSLLEIW